MNGELILVGSGAEVEPRRGADLEGFVKTRRKGGKEGGTVCGGSSGIDPQEGDRAVGVDLGSKGEGEGAVGGPEDFSRDVWKRDGYGVTIRVGGVDRSRSVEPAGCGREAGGF